LSVDRSFRSGCCRTFDRLWTRGAEQLVRTISSRDGIAQRAQAGATSVEVALAPFDITAKIQDFVGPEPLSDRLDDHSCAFSLRKLRLFDK
jgi:hypothetical protein